jgi:hypothetical protein
MAPYITQLGTTRRFEWSVLRPWEWTAGSHRIGRWVGPKAGLIVVEKTKKSTPLSSVSVVTKLRDGWPRFISRQGQWWDSYLFTTASRTALGSVQPPNQWAPGALSPGVKRPGCEAAHSPPSSSVEVKDVWSYPSTHPYVFIGWYLPS